MPYLRLTADRRGVEHTFLLHVATPGERAKVLYWYRTAPGMRIGRAALDDVAMRTLEEQYPEIDFDWPYILDVGAMTPVEVEAQLPPHRRKPRPIEAEPADEDVAPDAAPRDWPATADAEAAPLTPPTGTDLLSELLGRGIAASLRGRFVELSAMVEASGVDPAARVGWRDTLAALDPDGWESPETVLAAISTVEQDLDRLRQDVARLRTDGQTS